MKLRFLAMGCIISVLGAFLLAARGKATYYLGLLLVRIVLIVLGALWK